MVEEIIAERREHRGTYADYPECVKNYRWLVEEALKDSTKMFNAGYLAGVGDGTSYCKVCGANYPRSEFDTHALDHARQLKIVEDGVEPTTLPAPVRRKVEMKLVANTTAIEGLFSDGMNSTLTTIALINTVVGGAEHLREDVLSTVSDSMVERSDRLVFSAEVDNELVAVILGHVVEVDPVAPPLCPDCEGE